MDLTLLKGMYHTADAGHLCGNRQKCTKGTRRGVLSKLENWSKDKQDKQVFWLHGLHQQNCMNLIWPDGNGRARWAHIRPDILQALLI